MTLGRLASPLRVDLCNRSDGAGRFLLYRGSLQLGRLRPDSVPFFSARWEGFPMNKFHALLILVVVPALAVPARAGIFDKRPKPDPTLRVPLLIGQVKTEQDERKRAAAAEELRQYDPRAFAEIVPVLIDVLQNDVAASVRMQALHSLSSFRPVSRDVGEALEHAMASDKSFRIRLQARTTLVSYHWSGYHAARRSEAAPPVVIASPRVSEPPLAIQPAPLPRVVTVEPPASTAPPPIAAPVTDLARPLPMGVPAVPPTSPTPEQGPDLAPPPF
jgi:hypothetical protein